MLIHSALIEHKHGSDIYLASSEAALNAKLAEYCRTWWDVEGEEPSADDADCIETYFDFVSNHELGEYLTRFDPEDIT